jgi:hypothetical protein
MSCQQMEMKVMVNNIVDGDDSDTDQRDSTTASSEKINAT